MNYINMGCIKKGGNNSESDSIIDEKIWHMYSMRRNEKDNLRNLSNISEMNEIDNNTIIYSSESDGDTVVKILNQIL